MSRHTKSQTTRAHQIKSTGIYAGGQILLPQVNAKAPSRFDSRLPVIINPQTNSI